MRRARKNIERLKEPLLIGAKAEKNTISDSFNDSDYIQLYQHELTGVIGKQ
ncbi:MAG: hypothetical protein SVW57_12875 [Thermodesulfobacteriota bacterium]|nr:hypothetical protein [Thermodesulfobacteriota bacterium]